MMNASELHRRLLPLSRRDVTTADLRPLIGMKYRFGVIKFVEVRRSYTVDASTDVIVAGLVGKSSTVSV